MKNSLQAIGAAAAVWSAAALLSVAAAPASAGDQQQLLRECRKLQAEILRYESLRRDGGNARQMDDWKRQRSDSQRAFRELGCHYYHYLLD